MAVIIISCSSAAPRCSIITCMTPNKQTNRRQIHKLITTSSKSTSLKTLSHLVSISSPLALPFYQTITQTQWFKFSPNLAAQVIALLYKQSQPHQAASLISDSASSMTTPRHLALFYCHLIDAFSAQDLKDPALEFFIRVQQIPSSGRRPYESIIKGLCLMGMPGDAEALLVVMADAGFNPSAFEYKMIAQGYGQLGLFPDMIRVIGVMRKSGLVIDTVCANIVLNCYGDRGELSEMVSWIREMRELEIGFSVRTFNTVLNSCSTVGLMMQDMRTLPLTVEAFVKKLEEESLSPDEVLLVHELVGCPVFVEMLEWSNSECKLDLHGFHLASAYLTLLQWMQEMRVRLVAEEVVPLEISIVCGLGKHSRERSESPIKRLIAEMMFQLESPMRMDKKNAGRFIAKGKMVRKWLC